MEVRTQRGGMCSNPFGGRMRLDRLNLMELLNPGDPSEKALFLQTMTDAIHNYMFFGLGRNGTTAEEFAFACEYLFRIRGNDPTTWPAASRMMFSESEEILPSGKAKVVRQKLTDSQFRSMTFDTHWEFSGMSVYMDMDRFLEKLQTERRRMLIENSAQVSMYMNYLYTKACSTVAMGHQLPLPLFDRISILTRPRGPEEVARLTYLPSKYYNPPQFGDSTVHRSVSLR
jgi:hypothetical protein